MRRSLATVAALAVVAVGCSTGTEPAPDVPGPPTGAPEQATGADADEAIRTESINCEEGQFYWNQQDCRPATLIDLEQVVAGGPPPDGIPPINNPVYESIDRAASWLNPTSPVMVVDVDGDVRGYPLAILTWHEIVNDEIGGIPLSVTYCPLCNSALVFDRRVEGPDGEEVLDFGTSGRLYQSNLLMYDREHRNIWAQFTGEAVIGERFLGTRLTRLPAWLLGFEELAELHPEAVVLSRDTGYTRDYGSNPYRQYDALDNDPFLFLGEPDRTLPPMTRLVGLADDEDATAVLLEQLADERVVEVELGGQPLVVLWAPGQASALDAGRIDGGRDVGQTAAFVAALDGEPVELRPGNRDGRFVDERSGSTFDLRGRAIDGPLEGSRLEAVTHDDTFWFVWIAFKPDTGVVGADA